MQFDTKSNESRFAGRIECKWIFHGYNQAGQGNQIEENYKFVQQKSHSCCNQKFKKHNPNQLEFNREFDDIRQRYDVNSSGNINPQCPS